jgi:hypothetical protein
LIGNRYRYKSEIIEYSQVVMLSNTLEKKKDGEKNNYPRNP